MTAAAIRIGDWEISSETNSIAQGTLRRQVEPRAMDVLMLLCERANTVVSTDELLLHCWGNTLYGDNPVHKAITQLRGALGDTAKAPRFIETIRKRGYRIIADVSTESAGPREAQWRAGSPFRGLQAFDEEHAAVFFGREEATQALLAAVLAQDRAGHALTLVVGPSGSGKTSLVRAGLLPRLTAEGGAGGLQVLSAGLFDIADTGEHGLFTALGSVLLDWEVDARPVFAGESGASLGLRLVNDAGAVRAQLDAALAGAGNAGPQRRLALFVDRFEGVFTALQVSAAARLAFLDVLDGLARSGHILLILACRNDFYPQIAESPVLMAGKAQGGHFDLHPPTRAETSQLIRLPARAAGLVFGTDPRTQARLDDVLCDSAAHSPDALPLLQYTLHELYRLRSAGGELGFEAFHRLGGVDGAIGRRAEEVVDALDADTRASLPRVLSLLVTLSEGESLVTGRRAPRSALRHAAERALVDALVENRLFVSELVGDEPGFGVAHEALLRRWPRATAWIDQHRQALRVRSRIAALALRWSSAEKTADLLLPRGRQLDEARELLALNALSLAPDEVALIDASTRKARRRARLRIGAMGMIAALSVLTALLGVSAVAANQVAQQRRAQAEGLMEFMLVDFADKLRPLARLDLLDSVSAKALDYLSSSVGDDADSASLTHRAVALQTLAEVRIARGKPAEAIEALLLAQAILRRQQAVLPNDKKVLTNLGANAFWQGQIRMDENNWSAAEQSFQQYRDVSDRLHAIDPQDPEAWIEQSYAHNSLGSLALKRGDLQGATAAFQTSIDLKARAADAAPGNRTLQADLADSLSWLASARESLGELGEAQRYYQRELDTVRRLQAAAPGESLWDSKVARALQHRAQLHIAQGRNEPALEDLAMAAQLLRGFLVREPNRRDWQGNLGYIELDLLRTQARQRHSPEVLARLQALVGRTDALHQLDPRRADWTRLRAIAGQTMATTMVELGRIDAAGPVMDDAVGRLHALYQSNRSDLATRNDLARALLALSELRLASGREPQAQAACRQAAELLAGDAAGSMDYRLLDPWVRTHLCLGQDGQVHATRLRLAQIGYRETFYQRFTSKRK